MPRALHAVPPLPSLHTALERFLARSRFAVRTRESYAQDLAPLVAQHGDAPVTGLTHQTTVAFLAAQEHLGASTFNRRYAALRSSGRWCQQQGWLDDDPLDGLERRPQPRTDPRARDPEQVEAALRAIRDARDRALFFLIYDGGLRCQEALAINLEDIDWAERSIRIHARGRSCTRDVLLPTRVTLPRRLSGSGRSPRQPGTCTSFAIQPAAPVPPKAGYSEVELKRFSGHVSLRSLEIYIAHNREAAKRKARSWKRRDTAGT
jgi:integrase